MSAEQESDISDVLTNLALPKTSATLTLRIIKSFEYRTERSLVLHNINLETTTVGQLKEIARTGMTLVSASLAVVGPRSSKDPTAIRTQPGWKPYRTTTFGGFVKSHTPLCYLTRTNRIWPLRHHETIHESPWCKGGPHFPSQPLRYRH